MKQLALAVVAAGLCVAAPLTAHSKKPKQAKAAAANRNKPKAAALFREGNKLYAADKFEAALKKFRAAKTLFASYRIDVNIASTLKALERLPEAAEYYEWFLQRGGGRVAPPEIVESVREKLGELKAVLASVAITCSQSGAAVVVNGRAVGRTPLPLAVYLKPGGRLITVKKAGFAPFDLMLALKARAQEKINVELQPLEATARAESKAAVRPEAAVEAPTTAAPTANASTASASTASASTVEPPRTTVTPTTNAGAGATDDLSNKRRSKSIWAYTTLSIAVASAVCAGILYGVGIKQGNASHEKFLAASQVAEIESHRSDVQAARTKVIIGHVLSGVAAGAAAVSIYMFVTRPSADAVAGSSASASVVSLPGGAAVAVQGRF